MPLPDAEADAFGSGGEGDGCIGLTVANSVCGLLAGEQCRIALLFQ
ncbi:MAG: hypothetical protein WCK95_19320 [Alphaproteobacteria bacterium]